MLIAMIKPRNTTPPTVEPAMIPTLVVLLLVADGVLWLDVTEGADAVDDGELTLRHEVSDDRETCSMSEIPP